MFELNSNIFFVDEILVTVNFVFHFVLHRFVLNADGDCIRDTVEARRNGIFGGEPVLSQALLTRL